MNPSVKNAINDTNINQKILIIANKQDLPGAISTRKNIKYDSRQYF